MCDPPFIPSAGFISRKEHDENSRKMWFVVFEQGLFTTRKDALCYAQDPSDVHIFFTREEAEDYWTSTCDVVHAHTIEDDQERDEIVHDGGPIASLVSTRSTSHLKSPTARGATTPIAPRLKSPTPRSATAAVTKLPLYIDDDDAPPRRRSPRINAPAGTPAAPAPIVDPKPTPAKAKARALSTMDDDEDLPDHKRAKGRSKALQAPPAVPLPARSKFKPAFGPKIKPPPPTAAWGSAAWAPGVPASASPTFVPCAGPLGSVSASSFVPGTPSTTSFSTVSSLSSSFASSSSHAGAHRSAASPAPTGVSGSSTGARRLWWNPTQNSFYKEAATAYEEMAGGEWLKVVSIEEVDEILSAGGGP
ncbi:hypothetical protein DFH07DRAFT_972949 [Mycena maculata]|uniref:Uncharacterized protein n=1 Tax=Mycena maculata TaxID=230809 RepID=A0AAD7MIS6_9AGAR|nr:hypothetical protein DFH07DRAFT_972949 [Mycena maculata]